MFGIGVGTHRTGVLGCISLAMGYLIRYVSCTFALLFGLQMEMHAKYESIISSCKHSTGELLEVAQVRPEPRGSRPQGGAVCGQRTVPTPLWLRGLYASWAWIPYFGARVRTWLNQTVRNMLVGVRLMLDVEQVRFPISDSTT